MSISSSWYAEYAEGVRQKWADELAKAYAKRDWKAVKVLLDKLSTPTFSE